MSPNRPRAQLQAWKRTTGTGVFLCFRRTKVAPRRSLGLVDIRSTVSRDLVYYGDICYASPVGSSRLAVSTSRVHFLCCVYAGIGQVPEAEHGERVGTEAKQSDVRRRGEAVRRRVEHRFHRVRPERQRADARKRCCSRNSHVFDRCFRKSSNLGNLSRFDKCRGV